MQGALYATAIAEYFRDQGRHVLLLMDSLTRYAMAAREVALAIGEPPATKGYPPSVFARLRIAGRTRRQRLPTGTDRSPPSTPCWPRGTIRTTRSPMRARSFLDGHFVLTRALADSGHYPAIDIEQSISRVMHNVTDPRQQQLARDLKALYSRYQRNRDLLAVGAYVPGGDPLSDMAIRLYPQVAAFLQQDMRQGASLTQSTAALQALVAQTTGPGATP
jgi:flagellum-specific ATP synthase